MGGLPRLRLAMTEECEALRVTDSVRHVRGCVVSLVITRSESDVVIYVDCHEDFALSQ